MTLAAKRRSHMINQPYEKMFARRRPTLPNKVYALAVNLDKRRVEKATM